VSSRFNDELALVTRSDRGIGREIALQLATQGARLGRLSWTRPERGEVAGLIAGAGGQALVLVADLSSLDEVAAALGRLRKDADTVDLLVNNADVPLVGPPARLDGTRVRAAIAISLATLVRTQHLTQHLPPPPRLRRLM
jgi:NAD(P)-dependent dehydrogenase (short-subunit alcohol dehydrogenase family)